MEVISSIEIGCAAYVKLGLGNRPKVLQTCMRPIRAQPKAASQNNVQEKILNNFGEGLTPLR